MFGFSLQRRVGERALANQERFGLSGDAVDDVQGRLDTVFRDHAGQPPGAVQSALDEVTPEPSEDARESFAAQISDGRMVHLSR
jgi:hypothetical protein